ncbi:DUF6204 family protein, partial [Streptomyces sp. NPDC006430]|uniref:DUF6204 family protein n=1 Tax=Streptomyces sp. NPDC006430 TaxID=3154299 RepID=UPI0033B8F7BC
YTGVDIGWRLVRSAWGHGYATEAARMSTRTFRITVRGSFDALTADQHAELLAAAPEHDILHASHTVEGHLAYDVGVGPFFTFRFLDSGEAEEDILDATARAELAAESWLTERGYGFKRLTSRAQDLSLAPLSKRQRQAAARGTA